MSRNLSKLPFEIEKSVEESTSLRKDLEQLKQEQEKKKEDYDRQGRIVEFLKEIFLKLAYKKIFTYTKTLSGQLKWDEVHKVYGIELF